MSDANDDKFVWQPDQIVIETEGEETPPDDADTKTDDGDRSGVASQ